MKPMTLSWGRLTSPFPEGICCKLLLGWGGTPCPLPLPSAAILSGLYLCKTVHVLTVPEFTCLSALLWLEDSFSEESSLLSGSYSLSVSFSAQISEQRVDKDIPFRAEFSKVSLSTHYPVTPSTATWIQDLLVQQWRKRYGSKQALLDWTSDPLHDTDTMYDRANVVTNLMHESWN